MSTFDGLCAEDARLAILAELARQGDATLNVLAMERVLDAMGLRRAHMWIETQLLALEQLGAVRLRKVEMAGFGEVLVAILTRTGRDHVERRARLAGVSTPADLP